MPYGIIELGQHWLSYWLVDCGHQTIAWTNFSLTHWDRVMNICITNLTITGSGNGLLPGQCQAITWTNAAILLIRTLGTSFSKIISEIHTFSFTKMHLKMSSGIWWPFCIGLNVLTNIFVTFYHIIWKLNHLLYEPHIEPLDHHGLAQPW